MSTTSSSHTLSRLPTELLIRICSHLQVADLLSVQHSCRRFYNVISDSVFLQYILHTQINHLEAFLPLDVPLNDRVALLKRHKTAWKNLELNVFMQFKAGDRHRCSGYILQDGYLIYKPATLAAITHTPYYNYIDLRTPSHILLDCPLFTDARLTTSIVTSSRSLTLRNLFSDGKYIPRLLQFLENTKAAARPPVFTATEVTELDADEGIG